MKVKITFEWNPHVMAEYPCWAKALVKLPGLIWNDYQACGETWEAAERRLLEKLRIIVAAQNVPDDKEVEL